MVFIVLADGDDGDSDSDDDGDNDYRSDGRVGHVI
jgi:hypothetical protein